MRWLTMTSGRTDNSKIFGQEYWKIKKEKLYKNGIALTKYDSLVGLPSKVFQKWLKHPSHDDFWKSFYLTPEENNRIKIPILSITGHFDADQPGAFLYYDNHMKYGNDAAKNNHYLIIGPWDHGGTRRPKSELGGLKFRENAIIDMNQLYLDWFDWTLKNKNKPLILKGRVMYYEMGTNQWKSTKDLESVSNTERYFYLSSPQSDAKSIFHCGNLLDKPLKNDNQPDIITYDPSLNLGIQKASYLDNDKDYLTSQSYVNDSEVLFFQTKPIQNDITINGKIKLEAYISMNVVDTDLKMSVYEITSENISIFLQQDFLRARYRNQLDKPEKVAKNVIMKYTFNGENFFSKNIKKGSRIRLVISNIDSPNIQRNFNYWDSPSYQSIEKAQKSVIKLYHNKKYPSKIILPVKKKMLTPPKLH